MRDESEILRCIERARYREALERIVTRYGDSVLRVCYAVAGNVALAEEAAQEAFLRVWKGLPGFRREASVSTWIYTIARNTALRYAKTNSVPRSVPFHLSDADIEDKRQVRAPDRSGLDVPYLISRLPEQYRPVVILFYLEEKSYEEVARLLAMPIGTVKTYLHRARRQLAEIAMAARLPNGGA